MVIYVYVNHEFIGNFCKWNLIPIRTLSWLGGGNIRFFHFYTLLRNICFLATYKNGQIWYIYITMQIYPWLDSSLSDCVASLELWEVDLFVVVSSSEFFFDFFAALASSRFNFFFLASFTRLCALKMETRMYST